MPTVNIFYCYARKDQELRDELEKHLGMMQRQDHITSWHDRDISAGKQWENEIDLHLNTANIILLLISPDFMHSDYSYGVEMRRALQRHDSGDARVIPILLRPVDWENAPFSRLQILPINGTPVTTWESLDEAFMNVAKEIRKAVKELLIDQLKDESFYDFLEKRYLEALTVYEQAIDIDPYNALAYSNKGYALFALKRYEEALRAYEEAVQLDPENVMIYNGKGKALHKLHFYEEALVAHNEAIRIDPDLAEAYREKATVLEAIAIQARSKADEIEKQQINTYTTFPLQEKDRNLMRLGEMISSGKIRRGERVYVNKKPNQFAKIVDGHTVEFQGQQMSINDWAQKMTGWSTISIYASVYLESTKQSLGKLREEI
jgi:tetratricopeptide (TPR) repeat protein